MFGRQNFPNFRTLLIVEIFFSFALFLLFLSTNITGMTVSNMTSTNTDRIGFAFLLMGLVGLKALTRKRQ